MNENLNLRSNIAPSPPPAHGISNHGVIMVPFPHFPAGDILVLEHVSGYLVVERFFRTLKEQLLWLRKFQSIEKLREAVVEFVKKYNSCWMVAKHGCLSPTQV